MILEVSFTKDEHNCGQTRVSSYCMFMLYVYDSIKADG